MKCIIEVDKFGSYNAYRIRDPKDFIKTSFHSSPAWTRPIISSILEKQFNIDYNDKPGERQVYVVTGQLKGKDEKWAVQSVKVKRDLGSESFIRKIAYAVVEKMKACD